MGIFCAKCGKRNENHARFCRGCGASITGQKFSGNNFAESAQSSEESSKEPIMKPYSKNATYQNNTYKKDICQSYDGHNNAEKNGKSNKTENKKFKWQIILGVVILLASLVFGGFVLHNQRTERNFIDTVASGNRYLAQMNFEQAEAAFLRAIEINSRELEPYLALSEIYLEMDEIEQALEILELGREAVREEYRADIIAREAEILDQVMQETEDGYGIATSGEDQTFSRRLLDLTNEEIVAEFIAKGWTEKESCEELDVFEVPHVSVGQSTMISANSSINNSYRLKLTIEEREEVTTVLILVSRPDNEGWSEIKQIVPSVNTSLIDEWLAESAVATLGDIPSVANVDVASFWEELSVDVEELNIEMVSAGGGYTIALRNDGTVWSWGRNWLGQLGDGTATDSHTPVQIQGLTNVTAISAGNGHTIALRSDGTVWAWGGNGHGQLGDGTTTERSTPAQVQDLLNVKAISAGQNYTMALRSDGTVWAWGQNAETQYGGWLGDGTIIDRHTPVQVEGLSDVMTISSGGWHSVALRNDGTVWAWGANGSGRLGDGTDTDRHTPVQVQGLENIDVISSGSWHTVALRTDGTVWTWGTSGQLGDGTTTNHYSPVQVLGLPLSLNRLEIDYSGLLNGDFSIIAGRWETTSGEENWVLIIEPNGALQISSDGVNFSEDQISQQINGMDRGIYWFSISDGQAAFAVIPIGVQVETYDDYITDVNKIRIYAGQDAFNANAIYYSVD